MNISTTDITNNEAFVAQAQTLFADKLEHKPAAAFERFVMRYFYRYPLEELEGLAWEDVFGRVYGMWEFIQKHDLSESKVKVFNPNLEEHGWLSPHTVVAVLQRDMPFLVDSVRLEINRRNIAIHTVKSTLLSIHRDDKSRLQEISLNLAQNSEFQKEALVFLEINLHTQDDDLQNIAQGLRDVLKEVEIVVDAYQPLAEKTRDTIENLTQFAPVEKTNETDEKSTLEKAHEFLHWIADGHFTYLGYCEYDLQEKGGERLLIENPTKRLGNIALAGVPARKIRWDEKLPGLKQFYDSPRLINFAKASERSRVHRAAYPDYVIVKRFDAKGKVCGESRFFGLYTAPVYNESPNYIPIIRDKVQYVLDRAGFSPTSHDGKLLRQVLETFPRDELFQSTADELYDVSLKVAQINERYRVRLFMRRGPYGKFISSLLYVPRDLFNTEIRLKVQSIIGTAVGATEDEFTTYFSESILARVHMVFKVDVDNSKEYDVKKLEEHIVDVIRSWDDHLSDALVEVLGEERGSHYYNQFRRGFSTSYRDHFDARTAVQDIQTLEQINADNDIALSFYQPVGSPEHAVRFKIFRQDSSIELSDVIPLLENLGLRVIGEHPYKIVRNRNNQTHVIWLHDFSLEYDLPVTIDASAMRNNFEDAFSAVWNNQADSDEFNRLVLGARLSWREVVVLRSFAAYLKQTDFNFSQSYIAHTLAHHLDITRNIIAMFKANFDPRINKTVEQGVARVGRLNEKIIKSLDEVDNLNEDRIIRRYLDLINNCLRTNFFQLNELGEPKDYLSLKFAPRHIPDIPEPRPLYEIFVFSPRMEGVHLRGSKVARGGLRWSDRLEDYRTEVLGLVKAQQVKNAVIVPGGAKGGFVVKHMPANASRDQVLERGIACYQTFISGLLDITDNLVDNRLVPPVNVIRRDGDDPYLVVAADKGTASFSDIANKISLDYKHWLGDAFASGGSQGYDHKKMGITARGAWVGVQRHFREKGIDIQKQDFSVVGIGDMAGDVFGNGLLLSKHICLVAAFNHQHIFIDPNPDAANSFDERERLFNLPKSSWADYNSKLISKGGGIFLRNVKSIVLTAEIKQRFDIKADALTPNEFIHAILQAPVDLLWNGGIGTYVKSSRESHTDVGDKANDSLRVNGDQLRCKVVGEGGNLGLTQLGRVEFALAGGAINTDFVDNSAGVDCSDHEVNIKILLNELIASGDLTNKQRNKLLEEMTEDVAERVLDNNYQQTQCISIAENQSLMRMGEYRRFITSMQNEGHLNRQLEFLPNDDVLAERESNQQGLTRPELALLVSYAKVMLKEELVKTSVGEDDYVATCLERPFPGLLLQKYKPQIYQHRLRKEIIATQLANDMVNTMGFSFYHRLKESIGANVEQVALAYIAARDIYQMSTFREEVEKLDLKVPAELQIDLLANMNRRVRRATRWLLRNRRKSFHPETLIKQFSPMIKTITVVLPEVLDGSAREEWDAQFNALVDLGLHTTIASYVAMPASLYSGLGMVEAATQSGASAETAAKTYFLLGEKINLRWFASQVSELPVASYWQAMARETYLDDLEAQIRTMAVAIIRLAGESHSIADTVDAWMNHHATLISRWRTMISDLQSATSADFAMFSVALRELLDLAQSSQHCESVHK